LPVLQALEKLEALGINRADIKKARDSGECRHAWPAAAAASRLPPRAGYVCASIHCSADGAHDRQRSLAYQLLAPPIHGAGFHTCESLLMNTKKVGGHPPAGPAPVLQPPWPPAPKFQR